MESIGSKDSSWEEVHGGSAAAPQAAGGQWDNELASKGPIPCPAGAHLEAA